MEKEKEYKLVREGFMNVEIDITNRKIIINFRTHKEFLAFIESKTIKEIIRI